MNESDYISLIADCTRALGIRVKLHDFGLHLGGQFDHEKMLIRVNDPSARSALMTLAHEVGHAVGYMIRGVARNAARPQLHRERQAYAYGWKILRLFGADSLISRSEWIESCRDAHAEFKNCAISGADALRARAA